METIVHGVNTLKDLIDHHLLRELHHELHHADRGGHWPSHRLQEGGDDDGACVHSVTVPGRRTEQAADAAAGRRPRTSFRPPPAPRWRRRARCPNTRAGSTASRFGRRFAVGSIADLTFVTSRPTTVDEVNQILSEEAETKRYAGVLGVSRDPLVSSDIIGDSRASVVDLELTKVVDGDLVKVISWYDNEWGYANQMVREALSVTRGMGIPG